MDEYRGFPPVQLCEDRIELGIPEVDAMVVGQKAHTVRVEVVKDMGELGQRSLDVGKRQGGPVPELLGILLLEVVGVLVAVSRHSASLRILPGLEVRLRNTHNRF